MPDTNTPDPISLFNLAIALIPVVLVVVILFAWACDAVSAIYGALRMLVQLLAIGYVLAAIFESNSSWLILGILTAMLSIAAWISLRSVGKKRSKLFGAAFVSILLGGGTVFVLIIFCVLRLDPWYTPRYTIPLAGMIFSASMNAVSLAAERFFAEQKQGRSTQICRQASLQAALIPATNTMFAVGLVSIPGMMTGQVLAGVLPHIAARYQIMVMCMLYGATGLSAACFVLYCSKYPPVPVDADLPSQTS